MITRKMERIDSEIQKALSQIVQYELNDPRTHNVFISILKCEVTKDLKYCKAYVSVFPIDKTNEVLSVLKQSVPYIRKCLTKKVLVRNIPDINFVHHQGTEHSSKIDKLLKSIEYTTEEGDDND